MDPRCTTPPAPRQRGLSLIEVLVGVAIGVIGVLAIFQTVTIWTKHSQTTAAGGDAQISGTLALFNLERDLKQAGHGYGTAAAPVMGCNVQASGPTAGRAFSFPLSPVTIVPGAGGDPDQIGILYGNSAFFVDTQTFTGSTANTKTLARRGGFKAGDLAVVAGNGTASAASATCRLVEITATSNPDQVTIDHANGAYISYYAASAASGVSHFNDPAGTGALYTAGTIYDFGPQPVLNTWKIRNFRQLVRSELFQNVPDTEVADSVINLKAQYGIDTDLPPDRQIGAGEWTTAAPLDWTNVLSIRVAVLVRSRQFERSGDPAASTPAPVTASAPTWAGGTFLMRNVDGGADSFGPTDADPNNWRYYRYRVYERVIPFRNRLWN